MNDRQQIDAFARDLDALVSRYCAEFQLTVASAVGVLIAEAMENEDDDFSS